MFESIKKRVPIGVTESETRKLVSMECKSYTCLTAIKKERPEALQLEVKKEVKKEEELPYLDLDLDFNEENIMQAMVYSEIFGKPKSKRRKRR
jgi:hypothetical protein